MLFGSKVLWPAPRFDHWRFYGYHSICIINLIVFLCCLSWNLQNQVKLKGIRLKLNPISFTMTRFVFETAKVKKAFYDEAARSPKLERSQRYPFSPSVTNQEFQKSLFPFWVWIKDKLEFMWSQFPYLYLPTQTKLFIFPGQKVTEIEEN